MTTPTTSTACPLCGYEVCECFPDHDDNFYNPGVQITVMIPGDVYNAIVDVSDDNGQSPEVTVCAALDKMFATTPVLIPLDVSALSVLYLPSGKSVSDILPGKVKSARIEVLL